MAESLAMLPWYPGDFMRSTRGWSVTAKGVYRELLDAQWDIGGLPEDPEQLRALIGATATEWAQGWKRCEEKFVVCHDGSRRNTVLEHHRDRTLSLREGRSAGGKAAAAKRWEGHKSAKADASLSYSSAIADASLSGSKQLIAERCHPSPSPSPSPDPSPSPSRSEEARPDDWTEFEQIKIRYPERAGRDRWIYAQKAIGKRIEEGATWQQLREGAERYCRFMQASGKLGTEFVMAPDKFFSDPDLPWAQAWDLPKLPVKPGAPSLRTTPATEEEMAEAKRQAIADNAANAAERERKIADARARSSPQPLFAGAKREG